MTTPGHQFPALSEESVVRAKVKVSTLFAILGVIGTALVGFAGCVIFSFVMWSDVQLLKESQKKSEAAAIEQAAESSKAFKAQAEALQAIKDSVHEIEWRQKFGATAAQPSTAPRQP